MMKFQKRAIFQKKWWNSKKGPNSEKNDEIPKKKAKFQKNDEIPEKS